MPVSIKRILFLVPQFILLFSFISCSLFTQNENTDFYADRLRMETNASWFDMIFPGSRIDQIRLGIPGMINIENAVAASAVAWMLGVDAEAIAEALSNYQGVKRRFDIQLLTPEIVYIDDYAHHPEEISAFTRSVRSMFPDKKITGIF